jgi:hypothetical protein
MDSFNGDHTDLRQRQQDLLREAENRRLARTLRESRRASHKGRRSRKLSRFAAILARVLQKV